MSGRSINGKPASVRPQVECLEGRLLPAFHPLASIPALNSLPGAKATLYLDFNGHFQAKWGAYRNISIAVFDQDGRKKTFSDNELAAITEIWRYVAEDYAPFNVNVTTVKPPSFANRVALRVAIGGNGGWTGIQTGGFAYTNSFTNAIPNVSFVFPKHLSNGMPRYTAEAVSHEAAHGFGLQHQRLYSGAKKIAEYYLGPGDGRAPIMGNSYNTVRGLWWYGTTTTSTTFQDEMLVLSRPANGFGYRADDHGDAADAATPLWIDGVQVSAAGILTTTADRDYFSFASGEGLVTFTVTVPALYNNLDAVLELWDAEGLNLLAIADPDDSFNATVSAVVTEGSYRLVVASNGSYGDVGQYTVSGSIVQPLTLLQAPPNLVTKSVSAGRIDLTWSVNDPFATGYRIFRSTDGENWEEIGDIPAALTYFADSNVIANLPYFYHVKAYADGLISDRSNPATGTFVPVVPLGPTNLALAGLAPGEVTLTWQDKSDNELRFQIERRLPDNKWKVVGEVNAGTTGFTDTSVLSKRQYFYRIRAVNDVGLSAPSNRLTVKTLAGAQPAPSPAALADGIFAEEALSGFTDIMRAVVRDREVRGFRR
jgi:hypothetical protein